MRSRRRSTSASRSGSSSTSSAYAAACRASSARLVYAASSISRQPATAGSTFSSPASARSATPSAPSALPVVALERVHDALRLLAQRAGLAQPPGLDLERLVLARLEPGLLDLAHDVAQVVGPAAHLVAPARERRPPPRGAPTSAACASATAARSASACAKASRMSRWASAWSSDWVSCWPWRSTRRAPSWPRTGGGGRAAVDPGARAAFGRDLAPHDDAAVLDVEAQRLDLRAGCARRGPRTRLRRSPWPRRAARCRSRPARPAAARARRPAWTCPRRSRRSAR